MENLFNTEDHIRDNYRYAKLYRPSNGSEGEWFTAKYCEQCKSSIGCEEWIDCNILNLVLHHEIEDKEYPREWIKGPYGPECTSFKEK